MTGEFLKQLIQLLAQHGGVFTCPLDELTPLGLELSLSSFGSSAATLTLRLGARIYYVPAKDTTTAPEEPWPTDPTTQAGQMMPTENSPDTMEAELSAVTSLNNRPRQPRSNRFHSQSPSESPAEPQSPATASHVPKVKSELDLYLIEQSRTLKRTAAAARQAKELSNRQRQYPWETREDPPPKM